MLPKPICILLATIDYERIHLTTYFVTLVQSMILLFSESENSRGSFYILKHCHIFWLFDHDTALESVYPVAEHQRSHFLWLLNQSADSKLFMK
jgi:hypothetical protein